MKKYAIGALFSLISLPVLAAQSGGFVDPAASDARASQGGFNGPTNLVTVKQAKDMKDDSWLTLRGNIEKRLSDEDYQFRDETGTLSVEIDQKVWQGQIVSPNDKVELHGELDKGFNDVQLEVKQIKKISG